MAAPVDQHVENSSLSSAVAVTVPEGASFLRVQANDQNIRFTHDGATAAEAAFASSDRSSTTPTATIGFLLRATDPVAELSVEPGQIVSFIEVAPTARLVYQFIA